MNENTQSTSGRAQVAFGHILTPINLALVAAQQGQPCVSPLQPFVYCDCACGSGLSLCILAECYPQSKFVGFSADEKDIALARERAENAGLTNIDFFTIDYKKMDQSVLPKADFVVATGIYSWVSPEDRENLKRVLPSALSEFGLLVLHYSALPGMIHVDAFYDLIRIMSKNTQGSGSEKTKSSLALSEALRDRNANLFSNNSPASRFLTGLSATNNEAAQQEVLGAGQSSFWFDDVRCEMEQFGLSFVGQAPIESNILKLRVPFAHREFVVGVTDPVLRETVLDVLTDAVVRLDVYANAADLVKSSDRDGSGELVVLPTGKESSSLALGQLSQSTGVDFSRQIYIDLLASVEPKGIQVSELIAQVSRKEHDDSELWDALMLLYAVQFLDLVPRNVVTSDEDLNGELVFTTRLNQSTFDTDLLSPDPIPFAAVNAGRPILLGLKERLTLYRLLGRDMDELWREVRERGILIQSAENRAVGNVSEFTAVLSRDGEVFRKKAIPNLVRWGMLTQVPPGQPQ